GLAIGYRKGANGGTWIARHYSQEHGRRYHSIGTADDIADADSAHVLSFAEAQEAARKWFSHLARHDRGEVKRLDGYTVTAAMADYFLFLESDGRSKHSIYDARRRSEALIEPKLGSVKVAALTADSLRRWRDNLAKTAPRLRTRKGEAQKHREIADTDNGRGARRASANRTWTILRAALNHAFNDGKAES